MHLSIQCDQCGKTVKAPAAAAGKRGRCPHCKAVMQIPAVATAEPDARKGAPPNPVRPAPAVRPSMPPVRAAPATRPLPVSPKPAKAPAAAPAAQTLRLADLLAAVKGEFEPTQLSAGYMLGMVLVTMAMLLLPVLYVVFILCMGCGVLLYAVHGLAIFRGRGDTIHFSLLQLALYLGPLVGGCVVVLFMLKPLFARPDRSNSTRSLTKERDPLLFAFVEEVCKKVGAPFPRRIDVNDDLNASAGFRRGIFSFFGSDLVLTVGMPLVSGLSLDQFAGVLAHEFGHFAQGSAMRLNYIVRVINSWFIRVVCQRDAWDLRLAKWASNEKGYLNLTWTIAQLGVYFSRRVLWLLMIFGHSISSFLSREMEFDADRYEARMVGSHTFAQTSRRMALLNAAHVASLTTLVQMMHQNKFPDNYSQMVLKMLETMPPEVRDATLTAVDQAPTQWLSTHPSDRDRIASAAREAAPGIFHLEGPASLLIPGFDQLCREVTWHTYLARGVPVKPELLVPVKDLGNSPLGATGSALDDDPDQIPFA